MDEYMIFSMCSGNYRDAYDFVIDSWLATDASCVRIYTDDKQWRDERVEIVSMFEPSSDWLVNAARKAVVTEHAVHHSDVENIVFLDIDCLLTGGVGHVFELDFDIAVTRLEREFCSNGVFFMRASKVHDFVFAYALAQERLPRPKGKTWDYDQKAFMQALKVAEGLNAINLDYRVYNRKVGNRVRTQEQIQELKDDESLVLHFYNNSYRSERNVKEVFEALGIRHGDG